MKEKDMQVLFGHWVKACWPIHEPAAFELKICKDKLFNLKKIEYHQLRSLQLVKDKGLFYKISDEGMAQKPFDCFFLSGQAFIVLMFYKPRQPKIFYMIPITVILGKIEDGIKSISEEQASKMASASGELKS